MNSALFVFLYLIVTLNALAQDKKIWKPGAADVLFSSSREGNSEVYLQRAGQKKWINLTNHKAGDNWPVWSHDGTRIAFQSTRDGKLDIWTMNADGSDQRRLTDHPEPDYLPAWSPDGKSITFTSWRTESADEKRAPHIYIMNADGSGQRRLIQESLNTSDGASWDPSGRRIVYARKGKKGADIYSAASDGTDERQLTFDDEQDIYNGAPTYSPDGSMIAFYSSTEAKSVLTVMNSDGTGRRTLLDKGQNWYPRWSPDGKWIIYTAGVGGDVGHIDIFAIKLEGKTRPVLLVGGPDREQEGSWKPR